MLEINILKNDSQKYVGVLRGDFWGFGCSGISSGQPDCEYNEEVKVLSLGVMTVVWRVGVPFVQDYLYVHRGDELAENSTDVMK